MLAIDARHRLVGPQVVWQPTPKVGGRLAAKVLVMKPGTSGARAKTAARKTRRAAPQR